MTLDELKVELQALCARIDEPLAEEIRRASGDPANYHGQAWSVNALLPREKSDMPSSGHRVRLTVCAWFEPVQYTYK